MALFAQLHTAVLQWIMSLSFEMTACFTEQLSYYRAEMSGGERMSSSAAGILMVLTVPVADPCWFWQLNSTLPALHVHHLTPEVSHSSPTFFNFHFCCVPTFLHVLHLPPPRAPTWGAPFSLCSLPPSPPHHTAFPVQPRSFYPSSQISLLHSHIGTALGREPGPCLWLAQCLQQGETKWLQRAELPASISTWGWSRSSSSLAYVPGLAGARESLWFAFCVWKSQQQPSLKVIKVYLPDFTKAWFDNNKNYLF